MYKNNFDCSSTGINIEVGACYDTALSQIYFNNMFDSVWLGGSHNMVVDKELQVNKDRNLFKACEVVDFTVKKKVQVMPLLNEYGDHCYDWNDYTKKEAIEELNTISGRYVQGLIEKGYAKPKEGYKAIVSRGYCQGDYAFVICRQKLSNNYVDHLLWDCPVSAYVDIAGCHYDYSDCCRDNYEWNKNLFIKWVTESHTNDKCLRSKIGNWLIENLPEEIRDYV